MEDRCPKTLQPGITSLPQDEIAASRSSLRSNPSSNSSPGQSLGRHDSSGPEVVLDSGAECEEKCEATKQVSASGKDFSIKGSTKTSALPCISSKSSSLIHAPRNRSDGYNEGPAVAKSSERHSNSPSIEKNSSAVYEEGAGSDVRRMHKFSLYETATRFYVVGGDLMDRRFRILKIDRTAEPGNLSIVEDEMVYTKEETNQLLNAVDNGNKSSGGLKLRCSSIWGLLGFIRFTGAYYMLFITKRSQVAMIGGHYIYQVDATELVSLTPSSLSRLKIDHYPEEARFVNILSNVDLSRSFYFSYAYDVTCTLQHNISRERAALQQGHPRLVRGDHNAMFVWNHHLLQPAVAALKNTYDWCLPIIHGFIDQATLSVYGRTVFITIIARRSRFFAGARFLKRGANDLGYVANDVETEQIVSEMLTTSFHAPGPELYANPNYTSYVQHRGSIPLYWTQDSSGVTPKPDIELNLNDPFYGAAALHFDNLFQRYGTPLFVLNLVKARERTPRESILLKEYTNAITYLNQFLPEGKKIIYKAWDMSRASKSRDQDVIGTLEAIAEDVMTTTRFFHNGNEVNGAKVQNGVARTNCIDCLDRTNAAQFVIGKRALGHQLHALGIISDTSIDYDTDAVNLFTHMYHDHGDTIAVQYGGSHLVNTMETYRKINQWTSQSRDMVESFKRYYNNSFLDGQRQEAYNLFLGNYIFAQGQPMLWDLSTDYYLHHTDPKSWSNEARRSYIDWFNPGSLQLRELPGTVKCFGGPAYKPLSFFDDYWLEYYRPLALSSFQKLFTYKMNSTLKYIPFKSTREGKYDLSPFRIRTGFEKDGPEKSIARKGFPTLQNKDHLSDHEFLQIPPTTEPSIHKPLPGWLQHEFSEHSPLQPHEPSLIRQALQNALNTPQKVNKGPKDKSLVTQWTLDQFVSSSLNPSVTENEADEYERYVSHPQKLPLVVTTDTPPNPDLEFVDYVNSVSYETLSQFPYTDEDVADFTEFLEVGDDPLTVTEADTPKKRYKAYRQWLKGKSLFKQQRVDA